MVSHFLISELQVHFSLLFFPPKLLLNFHLHTDGVPGFLIHLLLTFTSQAVSKALNSPMSDSKFLEKSL